MRLTGRKMLRTILGPIRILDNEYIMSMITRELGEEDIGKKIKH